MPMPREARQMSTAVRRCGGQPAIGPSAVVAQSCRRMHSAISPWPTGHVEECRVLWTMEGSEVSTAQASWQQAFPAKS